MTPTNGQRPKTGDAPLRVQFRSGEVGGVGAAAPGLMERGQFICAALAPAPFQFRRRVGVLGRTGHRSWVF